MRLQRPPVKELFSRIVTEKPALARRAAVATPPTPAPVSPLSALLKGNVGNLKRTDDNGYLFLFFLLPLWMWGECEGGCTARGLAGEDILLFTCWVVSCGPSSTARRQVASA